MNDWFRKFAHTTSALVGSPYVFALAIITILIWVGLGPRFHYSDTWQLIINTGTTIITFLMVFLIQNTQNRDARSLHLKLDELIRANKHARNHLIDLEDLSDYELDKIHTELCDQRKIAEGRIEQVLQTRHKKTKRK